MAQLGSQACREEKGGGKPPREINKEKQEVCCRIMKCPRKEILEHRARENMRYRQKRISQIQEGREIQGMN